MGREFATKDDITIHDFIRTSAEWIRYLSRKWLWIVLSIILGLGLGYLMHTLSKPTYLAQSNIVLEESQSGGLSIGGGLSLDNGGGGTGLYSSVDNIIWLYTSDKMLREVLLSSMPFEKGTEDLIINRFVRTSKEVERYLEKNPKTLNLDFNIDTASFTRDHEKALKAFVGIIRKHYLKAASVEKTQGIIEVKFEGENELLSYNFIHKLVEIVNQSYIASKTEKLQRNVVRLTNQLDSLRENMNESMVQTAVSRDETPYPNPSLSVLNVAPQKISVDVSANTALYQATMQNLEMARNDLAKETPILNQIDMPILPLTASRFSLKIALPLGIVIGLGISIGYFIIRKLYLDATTQKN